MTVDYIEAQCRRTIYGKDTAEKLLPHARLK